MALDDAVELLERSLSYARRTLAGVGPHQLDRPTPCDGWRLGRLLEHMEDALDAFIDAAAGQVEVAPVPPTHTRVDALREKACVLLGAWASAPPGASVRVGDQGLEPTLLVGTAALEVTVHAWDVGQATGGADPIPEALARLLLPVARGVVDADDRGSRFAAPLPVPVSAGADERLLGWLGRAAGRLPGQMTGPLPANRGVRPAPDGLAS